LNEDKMKTWQKVGTSAVCALALLSACGGEKPKTAQRPVEVGVVEIHPHDVEVTSELPGRVTAFRVSEVRPQVSGILKRRLFEEGGEVRSGEPLYQIDPDRYAAALAGAEADLAKANATLKSVQAKASRYAELVRINAVSKQDHDDAMAGLDQARADVKAAKAALDLARIDLVYTRVNAPISGRIGKSSVTEGALVTANQAAALTSVTQLDPIYVDLTQSSIDLMQLRREAAAGRLDDAPGHLKVGLTVEGDTQPYPHVGSLQFSDVTVDQTTGTVTVRAIFPNPAQVLLPGMFVRAKVTRGLSKNVLTVPQKAVVRDAAGGANVWVPGENDQAQLRPVAVSRLIGQEWIVEDGLKAGDRVIVDGLQNLRPGVAVAPVPAAADRTKVAER
jgi:membrane fusion protein (multidrug efflux system)